MVNRAWFLRLAPDFLRGGIRRSNVPRIGSDGAGKRTRKERMKGKKEKKRVMEERRRWGVFPEPEGIVRNAGSHRHDISESKARKSIFRLLLDQNKSASISSTSDGRIFRLVTVKTLVHHDAALTAGQCDLKVFPTRLVCSCRRIIMRAN